jgi:hypothetical protein
MRSEMRPNVPELSFQSGRARPGPIRQLEQVPWAGPIHHGLGRKGNLSLSPFPSLSLTPSLSCARTRTHAHARARPHTHTHTHIHARTHARTHAHACTHARMHTRTHTHTGEENNSLIDTRVAVAQTSPSICWLAALDRLATCRPKLVIVRSSSLFALRRHRSGMGCS